MVLNPEVQEKARQELDRVIGRDRLPSLSDRGKLPYIDRIFYETTRHVDKFWHHILDSFADYLIILGGILLFRLEFLTGPVKTMFTGICSSQKGMDKTPVCWSHQY